MSKGVVFEFSLRDFRILSDINWKTQYSYYDNWPGNVKKGTFFKEIGYIELF